MHQWGDDNVDWNGINDCCDYFWKVSRRYGRLGGQIKEKYGTVRFYASFGYYSLHSLIFPGYVYKHKSFPKWLWKLDIYYISPFINKVFGKVLVKYQKFVYNYMYQQALKKWPHLEAEILTSADYPEFIKGRTRQEGNKLHVLGKNGDILSTWESGP